MRPGFSTSALCLEHDPGPEHPESPARLRAILERFQATGLEGAFEVHEAAPADPAVLETIHTPSLVERVRRACEEGRTVPLDSDTRVAAGSWDAALTALGSVLEASERVAEGTWSRAFCAVRPPGHHAEPDRAMGFCLFNTVAIAARSLRSKGVSRVAIVDWDVHHGNGTQKAFEEDPSVFYASLHQHPLYPGTGAADERGTGAGEGTTLNCPLPAGATGNEWIAALEQRVLPALESFQPRFVLVSAGFDAHRRDPLAQTRLETDDYRVLTARLLELAERTAGGRCVSVLEGGYDLQALADSVQAHLEVLAGGGG